MTHLVLSSPAYDKVLSVIPNHAYFVHRGALQAVAT